MSSCFPPCCGPLPYDPSDSVLTGMSTQQLQALLAQAQKAYGDVMLGQKTVTVSYAQGDGSRTVSFDRTSIANLTAFIRLIQAQLGLIPRARRPVMFNMA